MSVANQLTGQGTFTGQGNFSVISNQPLAGWGSMVFDGSVASQINFDSSNLNNFMSSDIWTIEWWQKQTATTGAPRPWAFGPWPQTQIGVSLEGPFILWTNGGATSFGEYRPVDGQWVHFAITSNNGIYSVYRNGTLINTSEAVQVYSINYPLTLGGESGTYNSQTFNGKITGFKISNVVKYNTNFTPSRNPNSYLDNDTLMLLLAIDNNSRTDLTGPQNSICLNNSGVNWDSDNPWQ